MDNVLVLLQSIFEFWKLNSPVDIFPYAAISLFIWKTINFGKRANILLSELLAANKIVSGYKRNQGEDTEVVQHISEQLSKFEIYQNWAEFKESFVLVSDGQSKKFRNTLDSQHFFNFENLGKKLEFYSSVPGLLTGIAILGTFVGIIYGIHHSEIAEKITNTTATEPFAAAIGKFLAGLGSAFGASVWGMMLSLIFTWRERRISTQIEVQISKLNKRLNVIFHRQTSEELLIRLYEDSQNQLIALQSISQDLPKQLVSALTDGAVNTVEIGEGLKKGIQVGFEGLSLRLNALNEFHDKYFSETKILFDNLKSASELVASTTKANETLLNNTVSAGETIRNVSESIEKAKGVSSDLVDIVRVQANSIEHAGKNLQLISSSFDQTIEKIAETTSKISDGVQNSANQLKESSEGLVSVVNKSTDGLKDGFRSIDQLMGSAVTQLGGAVGGINKHLVLLVEKVGVVADHVDSKLGISEATAMHKDLETKLEKVESHVRKVGS